MEQHKQNHLSDDEVYKLYSWVKATADVHKDKIHEELAEVASGELGFTITTANINRARKITGVAFESKRERKMREPKKRVYTNRVALIAAEMIRLMSALGVTPSPELSNVASGRGVKA